MIDRAKFLTERVKLTFGKSLKFVNLLFLWQLQKIINVTDNKRNVLWQLEENIFQRSGKKLIIAY